MRRAFMIIAVLTIGVAVFVDVCSDDSSQQPPERRPQNAVHDRRGVEASASEPAAHVQRGTIERPTLEDRGPRVILHDGARLPGEPWDTYRRRLKLYENMRKCSVHVGLTDAQEQAILLALYDEQQQDGALMYGGGIEMTEKELSDAVGRFFDERAWKIRRVLTERQRSRWGEERGCRLLGIHARRGSLRLPGDTPHDLFWDWPFRDSFSIDINRLPGPMEEKVGDGVNKSTVGPHSTATKR